MFQTPNNLVAEVYVYITTFRHSLTSVWAACLLFGIISFYFCQMSPCLMECSALFYLDLLKSVATQCLLPLSKCLIRRSHLEGSACRRHTERCLITAVPVPHLPVPSLPTHLPTHIPTNARNTPTVTRPNAVQAAVAWQRRSGGFHRQIHGGGG